MAHKTDFSINSDIKNLCFAYLPNTDIFQGYKFLELALGKSLYGHDDIDLNICFHGIKVSKSQAAVLELIAMGYSNKEIHMHTGLNQRTVESRVLAVRKVFSRGLGKRINDRELVLLALEYMDAIKILYDQRRNHIDQKQ